MTDPTKNQQAIIDRLTAENKGLYERIESLQSTIKSMESSIAIMDDELTTWRELSSGTFWEEHADFLIARAEHILELEGRIVMLSRKRGTGIGRGRPAGWTEGQAADVRQKRASGMTFRAIADECRLTFGQVQSILKQRTRPALTPETREDRLAQISVETRRFIAAVEHQKKLELRRAIAAGKRRRDK